MSGLKLILEKNILTGPNYKDWLRNVKLALTFEKVSYVLDMPPLAPLGPLSTVAEIEKQAKVTQDTEMAKCIVIASMNSTLQKQHEHMDLGSIFLHLKELYGEQSRVAMYEVSTNLFRTKMLVGTPVQDHVLMMIGYIEELAQLGFVLESELYMSIILSSLPPMFSPFIMNYNMHKIEYSLPELLNQLRTAETELMKERTPVLRITSSTPSQKKTKGKKKKKVLEAKDGIKKPSGGKGKGKKVKKDKSKSECFHCKEMGHWKRNCPVYLKSVEKKPVHEAQTSGIFVIENCLSLTPNSWVLDTGSGTHICNMLQGLRNRRTLGDGEMNLRMGNGSNVDAKAVGDYHLLLPNGRTLILARCYFVPDMLCNIISVSMLVRDGYTFVCENNVMNLLMGNDIFCCGLLNDGVYVLDFKNEHVIHNTLKRKTSSETNTKIWHYRLGHIGTKRLSKLHQEGYLGSSGYEPLETCEPCLKGKMTKAPFTGKDKERMSS